MADVLYEIKNITRHYGHDEARVTALKEATFTVHCGDFLSITGPSGSGKSTLLNILGLLDHPSSGTLCVRDRPVTQLSHAQLATIRNRDIGFVFQSFQLLPRTSALENVELPLLYSKTPKRLRRAIAVEALEKVGLRHRLYNKPSELSGGEQQRVAIARALVNSPSVILADEPSGALDTASSDAIMSILKGINEQGITIIVITHSGDVAAVASSHLRIVDGQVSPVSGESLCN